MEPNSVYRKLCDMEAKFNIGFNLCSDLKNILKERDSFNKREFFSLSDLSRIIKELESDDDILFNLITGR